MAPTRVLHIKPGTWATGGVETFLMSMFEHVDRTQVVFDVLTVVEHPEESPHDARLRELGGRRYVCVDRGRGPTPSKVRSLVTVYRLVRTQGYSTVHIHTGSPFHAVYAAAARAAGARDVILHSHTRGGRVLPSPAKAVLQHALARVPTERAACSRDAADWLFPPAVSRDVRILRNGIDVEAFRYDVATRARVREEFGATPGQLVLGHIGRFSWEKNHQLVLSMFKELRDRSAGSGKPVLVLVGDGEERAATERLAHELGLTADVRFLGLRQDTASLVQGMDVLVLPSQFEGLGIVGVEAQAAGLPCVFSTGVPAEIDVTGRCRFLPVTAPPNQWADEIRALARLPREDTADAVLAGGYDVAECARDLQALYLHESRG